MTVSIIVAMARNRAIGKDGDLPWRLSDDLKHFKRVTMGKPIVMGRKTYDSIGRPLPGRQNIVVTRDTAYTAEGCTVVHSVEEAIAAAGDVDELMIIGGATLYAAMLPHANRLYLTEVDADIDGDVFFPDFDRGEWNESERAHHPADEKNEHPFDTVTLERKT
jgi:dihydrofolate reductase